jgi:hypothetical protein
MRAFVLGVVLAVGCGGASVPPPEEPEEEEEEEGPIVAVTLRFEEAPSDEATDTPHTRVVLVQIAPDEGRSTAEVGTFAGVCQHIAPDVGAVLAARCWWAGFGARVTVLREGDDLVAYGVRLDEHAPASDPEEAARMTLPENARLDPILPATLRGQ